jgi:hypothetical protein
MSHLYYKFNNLLIQIQHFSYSCSPIRRINILIPFVGEYSEKFERNIESNTQKSQIRNIHISAKSLKH